MAAMNGRKFTITQATTVVTNETGKGVADLGAGEIAIYIGSAVGVDGHLQELRDVLTTMRDYMQEKGYTAPAAAHYYGVYTGDTGAAFDGAASLTAGQDVGDDDTYILLAYDDTFANAGSTEIFHAHVNKLINAVLEYLKTI